MNNKIFPPGVRVIQPHRIKILPGNKLRILIIICIGFLQLFTSRVYSQDENLTLNLENTTIREVLLEIEEQTDYVFMFNSAVVNVVGSLCLHNIN